MENSSRQADVLQIADATKSMARWVTRNLRNGKPLFVQAKTIARKLGAHHLNGRCEVMFWAPELLERRIPDGDIFVEVLDIDDEIELQTARQTMTFRRTRVPVHRVDAYCMAAIEGMRPGRRELLGSFYSLIWRDPDGAWSRIFDPLAMSLPFGPFAPAEYYDVAGMQAQRDDKEYYNALSQRRIHKFGPAAHILQVHVPTATASRTIAGLTRQFQMLGERIKQGGDLEPGQKIFIGYDAIQLMPVEPTIVYESGPEFWTETESDDRRLQVDIRRPDTTNWGYDVVVAGMAAVNPAMLESGRPDELVDLSVTLHNFPVKPKKLIFDVVYGHGDNQALKALNRHFFAGPNMYGQNINYRDPNVRAILLEMLRRKVNFGADGVRVDGAQDIQWWDADAQMQRHDDEFLQEMADVVQEVSGRRFRPWFIFEDGRPWPEEDWELSSDYRAVIESQHDPDVFQWGPLTFAHNTPFLYTFWLNKYWRIQEILRHGSNWISGCANHDTLRRGTQISPKLNINMRLGETRMEILENAYDHPAAQMLAYACFPGVPMDFLNATARASWGFIRNQDDRYGVKIVAEEAVSLKWQVDPYTYLAPGNFSRLKELGFSTREGLGRFFDILLALVEVTEYDLGVMAKLLNQVDPPLDGPSPFDVKVLKCIARAWMDDMHDYCNISNYLHLLGDAQTTYMLSLREFRAARPWLMKNLGARDRFDYQRPTRGAVVFHCMRTGPDGETLLAVVHMEGKPLIDYVPTDFSMSSGSKRSNWHVTLRSPQIGPDYLGGSIDFCEGMALLFTRR